MSLDAVNGQTTTENGVTSILVTGNFKDNRTRSTNLFLNPILMENNHRCFRELHTIQNNTILGFHKNDLVRNDHLLAQLWARPRQIGREIVKRNTAAAHPDIVVIK